MDSEKAFDLLVKDDKDRLIKEWGTSGFEKIKEYFLDKSFKTLDMDNDETKIIYLQAKIHLR